MAAITPFRALRPRPADAARVAAVPYDVVNRDEAAALAAGNPLSFLRVTRSEIELPSAIDPYSDAVYAHAASNLANLRRSTLLVEPEPLLYFYRLRWKTVEQTGVAGCFSIDEYEQDLIKKHERTRRDKEDDRTRHIVTVRAQTGPVFLIHEASAEIRAIAARRTAAAPLIDFEAVDGVRHTIWKVEGQELSELIAAFVRVPALYIADGHHRAASAARARAELHASNAPAMAPDGDADENAFLAVAFPHDEVQVLAYNRIVKDLGGLTADRFLESVRAKFSLEPGGASPHARGEIAMYFQGGWWTLRPLTPPDPADPVRSLDVSVLQDLLLEPILGIADVRTDKRIDFVGGVRGAGELETRVDSGAAAVAFSMFPVNVADLLRVSDAGEIMPPKSTWFEPKLRDGLLVHLI